MQVNDLDLYLKCHSLMDVSHTFQLPGFFVGGTSVAIGSIHQRICVLETFYVVPPCANTTLRGDRIFFSKKIRGGGGRLFGTLEYVTTAKKTMCFKSCMFVLYNPFPMTQVHFRIKILF